MKGGAKMRGSSRNEITKFVEAGATSLLPFSLLILPPPMYSQINVEAGINVEELQKMENH